MSPNWKQFLATMARDVIRHEKSVLSGRLILLLCFVALIFYSCVSCVILLLYYVSSKITIRQRAANSETRGFPLCIANLSIVCFFVFLHIIVPYLLSTYLYGGFVFLFVFFCLFFLKGKLKS